MNESPPTLDVTASRLVRGVWSNGLKPLASGLLIVIAAFSYPLWQLFRLSLKSELNSHVFLVPLVSAYFIWIKRKELPLSGPAAPRNALLPAVLAFVALVIWAFLRPADRIDALALVITAFVLSIAAVCASVLPSALLRALAFPLAFLVFMIPLPSAVTHVTETFLQHGSADVALGFFSAVGTPVYRSDLLFQLPGISLQVAPECSGIRSTLALFITSVVAGYLFLRSPWRRTILAAVVLPLALLRNGFRVFTIGELCVHISPDMIDSFIHHHGGPIFFALSLIPFGLVLRWLVRSERKRLG
jgi:exosortase C (VPDSG-CTERM-specific)